MSQSWAAPFTPRQRWILMQLALSPLAPTINSSADGKAFRRALRALGLTPISAALGTGNSVSDRMVECRQPALFTITAENVDAALRWAAVPRHPSLEMDGGEAFDLLEQLRADPASWTAPPDVPPYDPALEDWRPEPKLEDLDEATALDLVALIVDHPGTVNPTSTTVLARPAFPWGPTELARAQQLVDRHRKRTAPAAPP
jgi:hypothetical protein